MEEILNARNVRVAYNGNVVISGLDFVVHRGDVVAVLGPNGSGKTTLLKAVLGMVPLEEGRITVFGRERLAPEEAERRIAYIPQRLQVDRTFPISVREMLTLSPRGPKAEKYIRMLDLEGLLGKRVGDLSGGQMQRALLAYAIIKEPDLLIMDEPTSWVDVRGIDCVLCIMDEFRRRETTIVVVSHDFSQLKDICSHVLGLGPGGKAAFFERADSPSLQEKLLGILGAPHHGEGAHCTPFKQL